MFRSPLWEHPVQPTDFLLLRQSDGRWTVRRLQGTAVRARAARTTVASAPPDVRRALAPPHTQVAGHQEPFESGLVHPPGARENADYLDRLVQVVAYRLFRDKMEALERERRGDEDALVFDADFRSVLGRDFDMERLKGHLKEMTTARRGSFALAEDEEIPSEEVLREKLTPEMARARPRPRAAARAHRAVPPSPPPPDHRCAATRRSRRAWRGCRAWASSRRRRWWTRRRACRAPSRGCGSTTGTSSTRSCATPPSPSSWSCG